MCHLWQYSVRMSRDLWRPVWLSANSTRSSANISRGNLVCTKVTAPDCSFRRVCSRSATYRQKSKGLRLQPCLTPLLQGKTGEMWPFNSSADDALPYMLCNRCSSLLLIPLSASFCYSRRCSTDSKAFWKFTKQANV